MFDCEKLLAHLDCETVCGVWVGRGSCQSGGRSFEWGRHKGSLLIMITIFIMILILKRLKWLIFSGVISPSLDFQPNPNLTHPPTRHFVAHREGSLSAGVLKVSTDNRRLKFHLAEPARLEWKYSTTVKRQCIWNTFATNLHNNCTIPTCATLLTVHQSTLRN